MATKKVTKKRPAKRAPRTAKQEPVEAEALEEAAEKPKRKPPGRKKAAKKAPRKKASKKAVQVVTAAEAEAEARAKVAEYASTPAPQAPAPDVPSEAEGLPPAVPEAPETSLAELQSAPQSPEPIEKTYRVLVTIPASLYDRLQRIASIENRRFVDDEDLSIAQQAAMFIEAGTAMWEQDIDDPRYCDGLLEEPDYTEALRAQFSGATTRGVQP